MQKCWLESEKGRRVEERRQRTEDRREKTEDRERETEENEESGPSLGRKPVVDREGGDESKAQKNPRGFAPAGFVTLLLVRLVVIKRLRVEGIDHVFR